MAQRLKCQPTMQETRVRSLGWEDPLEKEMATHSSILAWRIPWTEEPGRLPVHGVSESQTRLSDFTSLHLNLILAWFLAIVCTVFIVTIIIFLILVSKIVLSIDLFS